jgi:hypothetical protein
MITSLSESTTGRDPAVEELMMITPLSEMTCVTDSRHMVGEIVREGVELRRISPDGPANLGASPHDDLARLALVPEAASAADPRDGLADRGLCRRGESGPWADAWM